MLADLIIFALIAAFVSVATLGHILLGVALLTGRGDLRRTAPTQARTAVIPRGTALESARQ